MKLYLSTLIKLFSGKVLCFNMNWRGLGFNKVKYCLCLRGKLFFPQGFDFLKLPSFFPDVLEYIIHCFKTTLIFNTIICELPLCTEGFFRLSNHAVCKSYSSWYVLLSLHYIH